MGANLSSYHAKVSKRTLIDTYLVTDRNLPQVFGATIVSLPDLNDGWFRRGH